MPGPRHSYVKPRSTQIKYIMCSPKTTLPPSWPTSVVLRLTAIRTTPRICGNRLLSPTPRGTNGGVLEGARQFAFPAGVQITAGPGTTLDKYLVSITKLPKREVSSSHRILFAAQPLPLRAPLATSSYGLWPRKACSRSHLNLSLHPHWPWLISALTCLCLEVVTLSLIRPHTGTKAITLWHCPFQNVCPSFMA